jgi:phosphate regulon transcriptional regulator PhoB
MKILVVEDEAELAEVVAYNLRQQGYTAILAPDADTAMRLAHERRPDLILLDVMLPGGSGMDICRRLRGEGDTVPILMLTARASENDRVQGLETGADDYLTKPFSMRELMARVKALLRRTGTIEESSHITLAVLEMTMDTEKREATRKGEVISLSRKEFDLLAFLAHHPGKVFDRVTLLKEVWGEDSFITERTVDVHIRWLREKIEPEPSTPQFLRTVRGLGYKLQLN